MIIQFIQKMIKKKKIVNNELKRKKIDFVYRYLLYGYEKELKGKVDLPAFEYATSDTRKILKDGRLNEAYDTANKLLMEAQ